MGSAVVSGSTRQYDHSLYTSKHLAERAAATATGNGERATQYRQTQLPNVLGDGHSPNATYSYPVGPVYNRAPDTRVEVIAKGNAFTGTEVGYTTKLYITTASGQLVARGEVAKHAYTRPTPSGVLEEDGSVRNTMPPPHPDQREYDDMPDELVVDVLPPAVGQQSAAITALLRGYTADMRTRMTEPVPGSSREIAFKPDVEQLGYAVEPMSPEVFDERLVGGPDGLNRIVLIDTESVAAGRRGETDTPTTAAAIEALRDVGCTPIEVTIDPARDKAIQVRFGREYKTADEVAVSADPADEPAPATGSGSGVVPPSDKPPTTFAEPPEEGDDKPASSGDTQAMIDYAASFGVQLTPEQAVVVSGTVRPPSAGDVPASISEAQVRPHSHSENVERLIGQAAAIGVTLSEEDALRVSDTIRPNSAAGPPSSTDRTIAAEGVQTPPAPTRSTDTDTPVDSPDLFDTAVNRLRAGGAETTDDIAQLRHQVTRDATHRLGDVLGGQGTNVSDLLPEDAPYLRALGPSLVDRTVSDAQIASEAARLGIHPDVPYIRERLLGVLGERIPPNIVTIVPDTLPVLTEGLTVASRLEEFSRLTSVTVQEIAQQVGVNLSTVRGIVSGGRGTTPGTMQEIMNALHVPSDIAEQLLETYHWEKRVERINRAEGR
jgi:hypothetical protein